MSEEKSSEEVSLPGRLRREMDELLGRFFGEGSMIASLGSRQFVPCLEMRETDEAIEITAEVPGLAPGDLEVTLRDNLLEIKGEKVQEVQEEEGDRHLSERRYGSFRRQVKIPVEVNHEKLSATHRNGLLKVRLPKASPGKATTIEVKSEA